MPAAAHRALVASAKKKGLTGDRFDRYVYGGLANLEKKIKRKRVKKEVAKP
jgi:hypothetical protein